MKKNKASSQPKNKRINQNENVLCVLLWNLHTANIYFTYSTCIVMKRKEKWNGLNRNQIEISVQNVRSWRWQDHVMLLIKVAKILWLYTNHTCIWTTLSEELLHSQMIEYMNRSLSFFYLFIYVYIEWKSIAFVQWVHGALDLILQTVDVFFSSYVS